MVLIFNKDDEFQYSINELTLEMIEDSGDMICVEINETDASIGGEIDFSVKRPVLNAAQDGVTWVDFEMPVPVHPAEIASTAP